MRDGEKKECLYMPDFLIGPGRVRTVSILQGFDTLLRGMNSNL